MRLVDSPCWMRKPSQDCHKRLPFKVLVTVKNDPISRLTDLLDDLDTREQEGM